MYLMQQSVEFRALAVQKKMITDELIIVFQSIRIKINTKNIIKVKVISGDPCRKFHNNKVYSHIKNQIKSENMLSMDTFKELNFQRKNFQLRTETENGHYIDKTPIKHQIFF